MKLTMHKGKIHLAVIKQADLNYVGSITVDTELLEAAGELHAKGIPTVVISLGSAGSLMSCEEGVYEAHVPKINAVNTVGCGDSMIGGFAAGIARGLDMKDCLRLASAISAASAMTDRTGFFRMEDMTAIRDRVEIIRVR